ncbi:hypothetical protein K432DRAFT_332601 [Lepidopterella palustris CBS 459.81]|uniref:GmrSD restriction endonucleases N-terminal domain-containing protein n=1 Tax=Lepidopterella palustris CBS 459.81 TaxID=1314670 RepID=A0A8E2E675_9PEZI|nr:hypothetical protein K432DRAFT_332601 [Lepidopterella palustris CBS 459.81]
MAGELGPVAARAHLNLQPLENATHDSSQRVSLVLSPSRTQIKTEQNGFNIENVDYVDEDDNGDSNEDEQGSFEPGTKLPKARVRKWTLQEMMDLLNGPWLELNPEYQREVVWSADRMTGLIDSLMEDYYIPPIIFNIHMVQAPNENVFRRKRRCVDGKQRISSVSAFMQGKIGCHDKHGNKWFYCEKSGEGPKSKRRILPENTKSEFRRKEFTCFEFNDLSPAQEEDLFARVQLGVSLNLAEKMRATSGPWQEFAKMFEEDFAIITALIKNNGRSAGFRLFLSCFSQILEVQHPSNANGKPVLKTGGRQLAKFMQNTNALDESTKSHLARVFTTFKELIEEDPQTFKDNQYTVVKSFSPVEFLVVAVMISMYGDTRNNTLLLGDIRALRTALRQNIKDLRMNQQVWAVAWEFMDTLEPHRGAMGSTSVTVHNSTTPKSKVKPPSSKMKMTGIASTRNGKGKSLSETPISPPRAEPPPEGREIDLSILKTFEQSPALPHRPNVTSATSALPHPTFGTDTPTIPPTPLEIPSGFITPQQTAPKPTSPGSGRSYPIIVDLSPEASDEFDDEPVMRTRRPLATSAGLTEVSDGSDDESLIGSHRALTSAGPRGFSTEHQGSNYEDDEPIMQTRRKQTTSAVLTTFPQTQRIASVAPVAPITRMTATVPAPPRLPTIHHAYISHSRSPIQGDTQFQIPISHFRSPLQDSTRIRARASRSHSPIRDETQIQALLNNFQYPASTSASPPPPQPQMAATFLGGHVHCSPASHPPPHPQPDPLVSSDPEAERQTLPSQFRASQNERFALQLQSKDNSSATEREEDGLPIRPLKRRAGGLARALASKRRG